MKKILLLLIFGLSFGQSLAQSMSKRKLLAEQFLKLIDVDSHINTIVKKAEDSIYNNLNAYFKQKNLDTSIAKDIHYFKSNVHDQITFIKKSVKNRLLFNYKNYDYKKLKNILQQIKKTKSTDKIPEKQSAYKTANFIINQEIKSLNDIYIPGYLEYIHKRQTAIKLKLLNQNKALKSDISDILIVIDAYKTEKISIFNKEAFTLTKPENFEDIAGINIIYKNKVFYFKPNPEIFKLPKKLSEMKNPVSKYSFEEIPEWEIQIKEDSTSISITLINVDEFTVSLKK